MVVCLERGADLHMVQLMPPPLTVSSFSKIQIGFSFLASAYPGSPGKGPLNGCVCVCLILCWCNEWSGICIIQTHPSVPIPPRCCRRPPLPRVSVSAAAQSADSDASPATNTMPRARRRGRPRTAWMNNMKTWTGLSVEESIRMTEDRDKWRKYVHGVAKPRIEDG